MAVREGNQPVTKNLRRILVSWLRRQLSSRLSVRSPASASRPPTRPGRKPIADHVDLVVDWYEVSEAAADTESNNLDGVPTRHASSAPGF